MAVLQPPYHQLSWNALWSQQATYGCCCSSQQPHQWKMPWKSLLLAFLLPSLLLDTLLIRSSGYFTAAPWGGWLGEIIPNWDEGVYGFWILGSGMLIYHLPHLLRSQMRLTYQWSLPINERILPYYHVLKLVFNKHQILYNHQWSSMNSSPFSTSDVCTSTQPSAQWPSLLRADSFLSPKGKNKLFELYPANLLVCQASTPLLLPQKQWAAFPGFTRFPLNEAPKLL